jgi:hypothetical protein
MVKIKGKKRGGTSKGGLSVGKKGKDPKATARGVAPEPEPKSMYSIRAKKKG